MTLLLFLTLVAPLSDSVRCVPLGTSTAGLLYLRGNRIDPPMHLVGSCIIGADTTWHGFYINGLEIWKEAPPPPPPDTSGTTASSRRVRAEFRAAQRFKEWRDLGRLSAGTTPAAGLAAAYQADTEEVDSVRVVDTHALDVYWRTPRAGLEFYSDGRRAPEHIVMSEDPVHPPSHGQRMRDLRSLAQDIIRYLSGDGVVMLRSGMGNMVSIPAKAHGTWWAEKTDSLLKGEVAPIWVFRHPDVISELGHPGPLPPRGCEP